MADTSLPSVKAADVYSDLRDGASEGASFEAIERQIGATVGRPTAERISLDSRSRQEALREKRSSKRDEN